MKPKTYKIIKDFKILFLWVLFFILNSKLYATNSFINVGSFQSDHEFQNFYNEYSRQLDELFYKRKNKLNDRKYEKISRFNNLLKSDKINEVTEEFPKLLKISKTFN